VACFREKNHKFFEVILGSPVLAPLASLGRQGTIPAATQQALERWHHGGASGEVPLDQTDHRFLPGVRVRRKAQQKPTLAILDLAPKIHDLELRCLAGCSPQIHWACETASFETRPATRGGIVPFGVGT